MPDVPTRLSLADLDRLLAQADPAVLLVSRHLLHRVIRKDRGLTGLAPQVPHGDAYVISRATLLEGFREDLTLPAGRELADPVVLLPRPDPEELAQPAGLLLRSWWRKLFHARLHLELRSRGGRGPLGEADLRNRLARLGTLELAEAARVLVQERRLLPLADDRAVYHEFVVFFLELQQFAPGLLPHTFPAVTDFGLLERIVADDVPDVARLLAATRPVGAADLEPAPDPTCAAEAEALPAGGARPPTATPVTPRDRQRALDAAGRGNAVRAALLLWRAESPDEAFAHLDGLIERLTRALGTADAGAAWREPLRALLGPASTSVWAREGRLLYDLQKVCVDLERPLYTVDLLEWAVTLGRRPIKRFLPYQGEVRRIHYLRSALDRLPSARVSASDRACLGDLLQKALHHAGEQLRVHFRPRLCDALTEAGLCPTTWTEVVARDQVIEELLDRVVAGGYLTLGDLRDALARNRLKLPDLAGVGQFVRGDPLLRANETLAVALDGVYHRGEVYLRGLQRFSSLFFGNRPGRWLTLYFLVPVLGALLLLEGLQHVVDPLWTWFGPPRIDAVTAASAVGVAADPNGLGPFLAEGTLRSLRQHPPHLLTRWTLPITAVFLFALLHSARFRKGVQFGLHETWVVLRYFLWELPHALLRPLVATGVFRFVWWLLVKPALYTAAVLLVPLLSRVPWSVLVWPAGTLFVCFGMLLNTRVGGHLEEAMADGLVWFWRWLGRNALPALYNLVMGFFRRLVERIDRFIYAVDERLRFQEGQSRLQLVGKALTGVVWGGVIYLVRFVVNLLIEPQVNPFKHFPVVTVSHKVMVLFLNPLAELVASQFGIELALAFTVTTVFLACIPGVFGFLAWELKENWRLYRANESAVLQPKVVGSHGETVLQLLHPGFHSGTIPEIFARLRRAERAGDRRAVERGLADLHHVCEAVRSFVERTLLAVLVGSQRWQGLPVEVAEVRAGLTSLRLVLACPPLGERPLVLEFTDQAGYLVAGVGQAGWLERLSDSQRPAFADALVGFYKQAGVDLIREQVDAVLPTGVTWHVTPVGLQVRTSAGAEGWYDFNSEGNLQPQTADGRPATGLRTLAENKLLFSRQPLSWAEWTTAWENDRLGKGHGALLPGVRRL